jgi:hypothetical protein
MSLHYSELLVMAAMQTQWRYYCFGKVNEAHKLASATHSRYLPQGVIGNYAIYV